MNNLLSKAIIFVGGLLVGSSATYIIAKSYYERLLDEEVESVKEHFTRVYDEKIEEAERGIERTERLCESLEATVAKKEKTEYKEIANTYVTESEEENDENNSDDEESEEEVWWDPLEDMEKGEEDMVAPYVITQDEMGDCGYDVLCLTMYANGYIVDDYDEVMDDDDVQNLLGGDENLSQMGRFDPNIVCIRNENYRMDYEIARDLDDYDIGPLGE